MMENLRIIIQVPHPYKTGEFKEIYRNSIPIDGSLHFDYQGLIKGLNILYPQNNKIINLTLM